MNRAREARFFCLVATMTLILGAACGGAAEQTTATTPESDAPASTDDTTSPEGTGSDGAEATAAGPSWSELDREGRLTVMREEVLPQMGDQFREFDAEEFGTVTCATCHGEDFQEVDFQMPNGLPTLVPAQIPTLAESEDEETARVAQFMFQQVVPTMVEILVVEPYDPATGEGFGCLNCHPPAE